MMGRTEILKRFNTPQAFAALFALAVILIMPFGSAFEYDPDEGINLAKAECYNDGFRLYSEIWNDQPPLFTVMLAGWLGWGDHSVFSARLLVLLMSCCLIFAMHRLVSRSCGHVAAMIAVIGLITSQNYIRLSVSVMIGLPSMCLAVVALDQLTIYSDSGGRMRLVLSSFLMAASLAIKLSAIILLPIFAFKLFLPGSRRNGVRPLIVWSVVFAACVELSLLAWIPGNPKFLATRHLGAAVQSGLLHKGGNSVSLLEMIVADWPLAFLAVFGLLDCFLRKRRELMIPLAWLTLATTVFAIHRPFFYHHYLFVAIPLAWLAGAGWESLLRSLQQITRDRENAARGAVFKIFGMAASALIFLFGIANMAARELDSFERSVPRASSDIVKAMEARRGGTRLVLTDKPITAFYAHLRIPPSLAVFSEKRLRSGELTSNELFYILARLRPDQVYLGRFNDVFLRLKPYLDANFTEISTGRTDHYYVSKTLLPEWQRKKPSGTP